MPKCKFIINGYQQKNLGKIYQQSHYQVHFVIYTKRILGGDNIMSTVKLLICRLMDKPGSVILGNVIINYFSSYSYKKKGFKLRPYL